MEFDVALTKKAIDWLAVLTALVLLGYMGMSSYALILDKIDYAAYVGAIGPIVGMLVGFWIRKQFSKVR